MSSIIMLLVGHIALAQEPILEGNHTKRAADSFNELSDISRNISNVLENATRKGDMERVQCIRSRQTSISALVDISQQAKTNISNSLSSNNMLKADSELRKISVALSKAKQFSAEVESCLASQVSENDGSEKTKIDINKSAVTDLIEGDESQFGLNTIENEVLSIDDNTDVLTSSEETPPPPPTSPYE